MKYTINSLRIILLLVVIFSYNVLLGRNVSGSNIIGDKKDQKSVLTLDDAILVAMQRSPQFQIAELNFMSEYWSNRSYKALFLPSFSLTSDIGNYNRSLTEVRDYETGDVKYIANKSLSNDISFSIKQNIALTGGTVSLNTSLYRLDQFDRENKVIYNSNPVTINYNQPLRTFNELKWRKKIDPKEYENAKRSYLESVQQIKINVSSYFFSVLSAQTNYKKAIQNSIDTKHLYEIAQKRFKIGTITKSELLQLELSVLNKNLAINKSKVSLDIAVYSFCSYLGIPENTNIELMPPMEVPNIEMDFQTVLDKANKNSTFQISQELKLLNADKSVAQAKSNKGIQINLKMNLGFSQTSDNLSKVYQNIKDQEILGLSLNIPICDWGKSKGQVKMSQARQRVVRTEAQQAELNFVQDIRIKVLEFNNQAEQCSLSKKAMEVAKERYAITLKHFENGTITVTDLNTALTEQDDSQSQYISQLRAFWSSYYELQHLSLYDFRKGKDISAEFDKIVK